MGTESLNVEGYTGPFHVIIIGAGAGGLLIAQGLKKNGISLTVYEKEPVAGRARDWGMAYFWSSEFVPKLLSQEILDKLPTAEIDYPLKGPEGATHEYVTMRNIDTGEELKKLPTTGGRRVSRRRLRQVLRAGIDVQYSKIVTEISYPSTGVVVHFEDGTSASGSLIIGADGGGSRVRRLILGERAELKPIPIVMNNFNVQYTAEQALFIQSRLAKFTDYGIHPKGFFYLMSIQSVPDASDPSTWYFQLLTSWHQNLRSISEDENTSEGRLKILKELTADMAEPRKSAMAWVPEGTHIPRDRMAIWSPVPWDHHNGRVTLAGDAAHSMTYHRGQGLNNCINDAGNLVQLLVEVKNGSRSIDAALTAYGEEVVKRGAAEVELSMKQTMMVHDWENFMDSPAMKIGLMRNTAPVVGEAEVAFSGS